jgi:PemK-like, MazF-like toxin of type II toxin-antitoxin system
MLKPGDVVVCDFLGAQGRKRRPGVVVSSDAYHAQGADVVVAELTTRQAKALEPSSCALQDWSAAGLHQASVYRTYFSMHLRADVVLIGHLSDRDWQEVQTRLRLGLAVT